MTNEKPVLFFCKAIGWALRQYSYTAPKDLIQFVKEHWNDLSPLITTEALKARNRNGYI
jgi:3-methyladenine DNA glycosylase AlkD